MAARVRDDAREPLAQLAAREPDWLELVARRSGWLVAAAAAAMLVIWLSLPPTASAGEVWIERSVAPQELAGSLVAGPSPPAVQTLLSQFPPADDEGAR